MTSKVTNKGRGTNGGRPRLSPAEHEAADAARAARIAALHERIGEQVQALAADPAWRAMLEAAARFHTYTLNNQLLIMLGAAAQGFTPSRVAGFTTWKTLGRSVTRGARGLAILAPCTYRTITATGAGRDAEQANTHIAPWRALEDVEAAADRHAAAARALDEAVHAAIAAGAGWPAIGRATGTTPRTAAERWPVHG